jgi:hypothetical protein
LALAVRAEQILLQELVQTEQILYLVVLLQQVAAEVEAVQAELMGPVGVADLVVVVRLHQGMREAQELLGKEIMEVLEIVQGYLPLEVVVVLVLQDSHLRRVLLDVLEDQG